MPAAVETAESFVRVALSVAVMVAPGTMAPLSIGNLSTDGAASRLRRRRGTDRKNRTKIQSKVRGKSAVIAFLIPIGGTLNYIDSNV